MCCKYGYLTHVVVVLCVFCQLHTFDNNVGIKQLLSDHFTHPGSEFFRRGLLYGDRIFLLCGLFTFILITERRIQPFRTFFDSQRQKVEKTVILWSRSGLRRRTRL